MMPPFLTTARIAFSLLFGLLFFVLVSLGSLGMHSLREYANIQKQRQELESEVVHLRNSLSKKQHYLKQMQGDPEFIERVIRRKFHYLRKDETLLRFSGSDS